MVRSKVADRLRNALEVDRAVPERGGKQWGVAFDPLDRLDDSFNRHAHLNGIRHRNNDLSFQRGRAAIPELGLAPGAVEQCRRVARSQLSCHAFREGGTARECMIRFMTEGTGDDAV